MKVIATAGHVDHGKSTLVQALSGIDPDRLSEEKARGMTIDLGFAWLELPNGEPVGIVDVPGHIDFIKNMLAGVGSVDAVLFIIAADEGVMPQTREHLDIIDLLGVPRGVIALTKIDLVEEAGWLELVQEEIRDLLAPTALADAPIVPVSARTKSGLGSLLVTLGDVLASAPERPDLGRPRLPIDRVFTIAGFGTVVTGTLIDGNLHLGDEIVIEPGSLRTRIRGLQTHKTKLDIARPGSRVAVNLTGVHPDQLHRGQVLTLPGVLRGAMRIDARLRALPDNTTALHHNMAISFHSGAAESFGRLRLLETDELRPGDETWAQIELSEPIAVARGDHFILRRPSPSATLGGGVIVDPAPRRRHRRRDPQIFAQLETLLAGDPADLLADAIAQHAPIAAADAIALTRLDAESGRIALATLQQTGRAEALDPGEPDGPLITPHSWRALCQRLHDILQTYHRANPLRAGMPREEVKSRLQPKTGWSNRLFAGIIARAAAENFVRETPNYIALPDFRVQFSPEQQRAVDKLLAAFAASSSAPPSVKESLDIVDEPLFNALLEQGLLMRVAADVVFERATYDRMVATVRQHLQTHGQITVAECRDLFDTSRKYALALLEHLDQMRVTRREGDIRILRG